jgi:hypothetical protein
MFNTVTKEWFITSSQERKTKVVERVGEKEMIAQMKKMLKKHADTRKNATSFRVFPPEEKKSLTTQQNSSIKEEKHSPSETDTKEDTKFP